jgi:thiamine-monophosphate kinase
MIDVSDGIAKDLRTLCAESGVGAVVREHELPVPSGIAGIFGLDWSALVDFAVASGEEYVLLATVAPDRIGLLKGAAANIPAGVLAIGTIVPASEGVMLADKHGSMRPMPELGYEHTF